MTDKTKVIELVLKEFQKVLLDLHENNNIDNTTKYGFPPESAIIKYHDRYDPQAMKIGKIISAWKVSLNQITQIDQLDIEHLHKPISGMYFNEGSFLFAISNDYKYLILEWQVGPRFGRGFRYKIVQNEKGEIEIHNEKLLWIS